MSRARDFADLAGAADAGTVTGHNLIINGDMAVAQRGSSAVTIADAATYRVDRFNAYDNTGGAFTYEQSTTTPSAKGFKNSAKLTVTSNDTSIAAGEYAYIAQYVEGTNFSQCGFGASGAKTVTVSFWVRSSATGTYCVTLANSASNRSFVSEYSIDTADTWEYKTITVAGDTTGTWLTTTGIGLKVFFTLAVGSTYQQSAGSWGATSYAFGSSNQENWLATNSNTFYLTGVKLEAGDTATDFQHISYGDNLTQCERYYQVYGISSDNISTSNFRLVGSGNNSTQGLFGMLWRQKMRSAPTLNYYGGSTDGGNFNVHFPGTATLKTAPNATNTDYEGVRGNFTCSSSGATRPYWIDFGRQSNAFGLTCDAEL